MIRVKLIFLYFLFIIPYGNSSVCPECADADLFISFSVFKDVVKTEDVLTASINRHSFDLHFSANAAATCEKRDNRKNSTNWRLILPEPKLEASENKKKHYNNSILDQGIDNRLNLAHFSYISSTYQSPFIFSDIITLKQSYRC
jgi:hypothetical protein